MDWAQLLTLLKQYGPVVAVLLFIVYFQTRQIDKLLSKNAEIYEGHIQHLWETQQRLLTRILGPQESSQTAPTMDDLKKGTLAKPEPPKELTGGSER